MSEKPIPGGKVVELTYYPITPGYTACMHDAEKSATYFKFGGRFISAEKLLAPSKLEDVSVVWASTKGWLAQLPQLWATVRRV